MNSNKNTNSWYLALITFGFFMIAGSPIIGQPMLMITSGVFFVVLGFAMMKFSKK